MKNAQYRFLVRPQQRGLSLVELMIGMALGLVVILAVVYVFAGSRASYRHQESFSGVQEAGRIALEVLGRDIRMAGNPGCGNLGVIEHRSAAIVPPEAQFSNAVAVTGNQGTLTVVRGSAESALLAVQPASNQIQVDNLAALGAVVAGDRLLLSDCVYSEVLTVNVVAGNLLTAAVDLSRQYRPGTQVMRLERIVFARSAANELTRNGQPVVGGVTALEFQYGLVGPGTRSVQEYASTPTLPQLSSAVSVRTALTVTQADVAMSFNNTVALRNRAP